MASADSKEFRSQTRSRATRNNSLLPETMLAISFVFLLCSMLSIPTSVSAVQQIPATIALLCRACPSGDPWTNLLNASVASGIQQALGSNSSVFFRTVTFDATVVTPDLLTSNGVVHAIVLDLAISNSIPIALPRVTFSVFVSNSVSVSQFEALENVETISSPIVSMGYEAGALAGLVSSATKVSVWYSNFYSGVDNGARQGLKYVCPLCEFHTQLLCSNVLLCPNEWNQAMEDAEDADVVILAVGNNSYLLEQLIASADNTGWPSYVLSVGALNPLPSTVSNNTKFLGAINFDMKSAMQGAADALNRAFSSAHRTLPYSWLPNENIVDPSLMQPLKEFSVVRQLVRWGVTPPVLSVLDMVSVDADLVGGLPFTPIGHAVGGLSTDTAALPNISSYASTCVLRDRLVLISSDLTMVTVVTMNQINDLTINMSDATFMSAAQDPNFASVFQVSRRLYASSGNRRMNVKCVMVNDVTQEMILYGGQTVDPSTNQPISISLDEVLHLVPYCAYGTGSVCDYFILENITNEFLFRSSLSWDLWTTSGTGGVDKGIGYDAGFAPTALFGGSLWFGIPRVDASTTKNYVNNYVRVAVVNNTNWQTQSSILLYPPIGVNVRTFKPQFGLWLDSMGGYYAFDVARRVIVMWANTSVVASVTAGGSSSATREARWVDVSKTPLSSRVSVQALFYNAAAKRLAVFGFASSLEKWCILHYSLSLDAWLERGNVDRSLSSTLFSPFPMPKLNGGDLLLYPTNTLEASSLILVDYPSVAPVCATPATSGSTSLLSSMSAMVLTISQTACESCPVGQTVSVDGFCFSNIITSSLSGPATAGIAVGSSVFVVAVVVIAWGAYRRWGTSDTKRNNLATNARAIQHAPPSGNCCVMVILLSDADILWGGGAATRAAAEAAIPPAVDATLGGTTNEAAAPSSPRTSSFAKNSNIAMHDIVDQFHDTLCRSVAANRCFLASFRGDQAVVVSVSPADLLCVAVEVSFTASCRDPPIRLSCGMHVAELTRSLDQRLNKIFYSGPGLRQASRLASTSKKGAFVVSEVFLDEVGDAVLKHLGIVRGHTHSVAVDDVSIGVRELLVHSVVDQFESSSYLDTKDRRQKVLRHKRRATAREAGRSSLSQTRGTTANNPTTAPLQPGISDSTWSASQDGAVVPSNLAPSPSAMLEDDGGRRRSSVMLDAGGPNDAIRRHTPTGISPPRSPMYGKGIALNPLVPSGSGSSYSARGRQQGGRKVVGSGNSSDHGSNSSANAKADQLLRVAPPPRPGGKSSDDELTMVSPMASLTNAAANNSSTGSTAVGGGGGSVGMLTHPHVVTASAAAAAVKKGTRLSPPAPHSPQQQQQQQQSASLTSTSGGVGGRIGGGGSDGSNMFNENTSSINLLTSFRQVGSTNAMVLGSTTIPPPPPPPPLPSSDPLSIPPPNPPSSPPAALGTVHPPSGQMTVLTTQNSFVQTSFATHTSSASMNLQGLRQLSTTSNQSAILSRLVPLTQMELDCIGSLAVSMGRVLLTHLGSVTNGDAAFELIVTKLHMPVHLGGKYASAVISSSALKIFAQRLIAMSPALIIDVRELAEASSSSSDQNLVQVSSALNATTNSQGVAQLKSSSSFHLPRTQSTGLGSTSQLHIPEHSHIAEGVAAGGGPMKRSIMSFSGRISSSNKEYSTPSSRSSESPEAPGPVESLPAPLVQADDVGQMGMMVFIPQAVCVVDASDGDACEFSGPTAAARTSPRRKQGEEGVHFEEETSTFQFPFAPQSLDASATMPTHPAPVAVRQRRISGEVHIVHTAEEDRFGGAPPISLGPLSSQVSSQSGNLLPVAHAHTGSSRKHSHSVSTHTIPFGDDDVTSLEGGGEHSSMGGEDSVHPLDGMGRGSSSVAAADGNGQQSAASPSRGVVRSTMSPSRPAMRFNSGSSGKQDSDFCGDMERMSVEGDQPAHLATAATAQDSFTDDSFSTPRHNDDPPSSSEQ